VDDLEKSVAFRKEAKKAGLALEYHLHVNVFVFDLNMGEIITLQVPEKVMALVQLAREYAAHDSYGEHNALLQLVTPRDEVGSSCCYWHRPYYVRYDPATWITLKEWLEEHDQNPDSIYSGSE